MELETPTPAAVWLCQLSGLDGRLLLRLLDRWGSAESVLRAPSHALRAEGLTPALVARFVAAPRELPRVVESLRGLRRLGVGALPIAAPAYPERLRQLPAPPPVVYVQGRWPLNAPVLLMGGAPPVGDAAAAWNELAASIAGEAVLAASAEPTPLPGQPEAPAAVDGAVGLVGLAGGILHANSHLARELLARVAAGRTTLLSTAPPGAQVTAEHAASSLAVLACLADAVVLFDGAAPPAGFSGVLFAWQAAGQLPRGIRKLRPGKAGAKMLRAALGIHKSGQTTAHQERLWGILL